VGSTFADGMLGIADSYIFKATVEPGRLDAVTLVYCNDLHCCKMLVSILFQSENCVNNG
jgi:hypothetical protein